MSLAFAIPIVDPSHPAVADYAIVERALEITLHNLVAQTCGAATVAVACHRRPAWADRFRGRVEFVVLPEMPLPPRKRSGQRLDKMLKWSVAALSLHHRRAPDHIMLVDGDDLIHPALSQLLASGSLGPGGRDGYIVTAGYNLHLRAEGTGIGLAYGFRVHGFDRSCGSCRIFRAGALTGHLSAWIPGVLEASAFLAEGGAAPDPAAFARLLDAFETAKAHHGIEMGSPLNCLGRHVGQSEFFAFDAIDEPLAVKVLGHGNHHGPNRGGVRWDKFVEAVDLDWLSREFALDGLEGVHVEADPSFARYAAYMLPIRRRLWPLQRQLSTVRARIGAARAR